MICLRFPSPQKLRCYMKVPLPDFDGPKMCGRSAVGTPKLAPCSPATSSPCRPNGLMSFSAMPVAACLSLACGDGGGGGGGGSGSSDGGGEDGHGGGRGGGMRKRREAEGGRRHEATAKRARRTTETTGDHGEGGERRSGEG